LRYPFWDSIYCVWLEYEQSCLSCLLFLGLKQALATVNDYNPLMKDFPINDLLSATELDRIRAAVQQIFSHLRKIRNTKYPIQRALRLVEAISRDLSSQLLKVTFLLSKGCFLPGPPIWPKQSGNAWLKAISVWLTWPAGVLFIICLETSSNRDFLF